MNPTPKRRMDGQNRFTLTVEFHPGRQELIRVVAWRSIRFNSPTPTTRQEVLELAQQTYGYFGTSFEALVADADQKAIEEKGVSYSQLAENAIDQLFPELMDRQLADISLRKINSGAARFEERPKDLSVTKIGRKLKGS